MFEPERLVCGSTCGVTVETKPISWLFLRHTSSNYLVVVESGQPTAHSFSSFGVVHQSA